MRGAREQLIAAVLRTSPPEPADAIIVLCGEDMKPRCDVAHSIFKRQYAKTIVLTGGKHAPPRIEGAKAARDYLITHPCGAISLDRIIVDGSAMNTRDQAVNVVEMAKAHGWTRLILVASEYHLSRAMLTFIRALDEVVVWENEADSDDLRTMADEVRLFPVSTSQMNIHDSPEGMTASRLEMLTTDADKVEAYSLHCATFVEGIEYLKEQGKP